MPDTTYTHGAVWESGTFTVPMRVGERVIDEEAVQAVADKYMARFGDVLEKRGYTVLRMLRPSLDKQQIGVDPDRRRYVIWAWVKRRPVLLRFNIPDDAVPEMLKAGFALID